MKHTLRALVLLVICIMTAFASVTASATTSDLKCNAQKDKVWVYDSLTTFDVQVKLSCTETVEILDRVNGYVKVRTQEGLEGYILESAFSDLPKLRVQHDPTHDVGYVAKTVQAKEIAKATAANGEFVTAGGDSPNASDETASVKSPSNSANRKSAPGVVSLLPNEMAEMNPRRATTSVNKPSASVSDKNSAAGPLAPASSKPLDAAAAVVTKPVPQPAVAAVLSTPAGDVAARPEEEPSFRLEADSDPACRRYFSAYGLTANQLKWIAQNRTKVFPGVCPAPDVSKVNYVIIFTHDVSFFGGTMPDTVHNLNGFSDFRPMTPVDNALLSESEADKAHREYVWVFRVTDGGFNPEAFSPHRSFQFTKVETNALGSRAGAKVVEEAFRFVESANP